MSLRSSDISQIVRQVHDNGGSDEAEALATDMVIAGLAWLRIINGPRFCAETCDRLAHDFTGEVLGQPFRRAR